MTNLPGFGFLPANVSSPPTLMSILTSLGLITNLKIALDAGDITSWPGSGQKWLDMSGNVYDFFLGSTVGAAGDDPVFNGIPGALSASEYWSFNGSQWFRYALANEAWMQTLHTGTAKFAFMCWFYANSLGVNYSFFGDDRFWTTDVGACSLIRTTNVLRMGNTDGSGVNLATLDSVATVNLGWNCVGASLDNAGAVGITMVNGVTRSTAFSYSATVIANATRIFEIAAEGIGFVPFPSGSRMANFTMWQARALTAVEMSNFYDNTRARFGV